MIADPSTGDPADPDDVPTVQVHPVRRPGTQLPPAPATATGPALRVRQDVNGETRVSLEYPGARAVAGADSLPSSQVRRAQATGRLAAPRAGEAWEPYERMMIGLGASQADIHRERQAWLRRQRTAAPPFAGSAASPPVVTPTADSEIRADTPAALAALLHTLQVRSGLNVSQFGRHAHISRSQMYALTRTGRMALPTQPDQLRTFAITAGLPAHQVEAVITVWTTLLRQKRLQSAPPPSSAPEQVSESTLVRAVVHGVVEEVRELTAPPGVLPVVPPPRPRRSTFVDFVAKWGILVAVISTAITLTSAESTRAAGPFAFVGLLIAGTVLGYGIHRFLAVRDSGRAVQRERPLRPRPQRWFSHRTKIGRAR